MEGEEEEKSLAWFVWTNFGLLKMWAYRTRVEVTVEFCEWKTFLKKRRLKYEAVA